MKFSKIPLEMRVERYYPKYRKCAELGQRPPFFDRLFKPYTIAGCRIQQKCVSAEAEIIAAKNEVIAKEAKTSRLLSIIIHDVRSAISGSIGFSDLLLNGSAESPEEVGTWAKLIYKSNAKALTIINDVALWRDSGQIEAKPVMFDVGKVVDENILLFLGNVAYKKQIDLSSDIQLGDVLAFADENMASQIIQNLISNAMKFTPKGGKVLVSAKSVGKAVEISVADTGVGMRPEMVAALFNVEKTFTTAGTENEPGTGLGLTIVHELAEKNNGSIRVQSEVGKGTTFTVTLPAAQD